MTKKYFFFDIDGTWAWGSPASSGRHAVLPAPPRPGSHFIAIASGRLQHDTQTFADRYGIPAVVADGGNSLSLDGKILEMTGLPLENCKALLRDLTDRHYPWAVVTGQYDQPLYAVC